MRTLVTTCAIKINDKKLYDEPSYLEKGKILIKSYLKYTDFDILIITNNVDFYDDIKNERVIIIDYHSNYDLPITSKKHFNMHIKRLPIECGSKLDYDIIYHHDCDCYIEGWDEESYQGLISKDFDVFVHRHDRPEIGKLRKISNIYKNKINLEYGDIYYDELDMSPNPTETRMIFKNNDKLKVFLEFWKKISDRNKDYLTYYCGLYFGTSIKHANMKTDVVSYKHKFTEYGRIFHHGGILSYFGDRIKK